MQGLNLRAAPHVSSPLLTRRPHRPHTAQAFRADDASAPRSASTARLQTDAAQPLWKKPSFPFVVAIALATLPYDLANHHIQPRDSKTHGSPASTSKSSAPQRHAKPAGRRRHSPAVGAAPPARDVGAVRREAAAAAAAAAATGQGSQHQQQQQEQAAGAGRARKAAQAAADSKHTPKAASSAAQAPPTTQPAEPWPVGAMGAAAGPVDSWDASDAGIAGFSDEEAEQQAKAMVIELLTHPKDTEEALMRAAAADPGSSDSPGGYQQSVSPEYIDALVHAVQDPSMGMPHHQPGASNFGSLNEPPQSVAPSSSSSSSDNRPGVEEAATSSSSSTQRRRRRQPTNSSLWSWLDASPRSSQEEF